jgi:hypothetical protein
MCGGEGGSKQDEGDGEDEVGSQLSLWRPRLT